MKKLLIFFFLCTTVFAWVGSEATVQLVYPQPSKTWQPFFVPGAVYGIVFNLYQGIAGHQVILEDLVTHQTKLIKETCFWNYNPSVVLLTEGELIKARRDVVIGRKYKVILRAFDWNGDYWESTAIIQVRRRNER